MKGAPLACLVVTHRLMDDDGQVYANDDDAGCGVVLSDRGDGARASRVVVSAASVVSVAVSIVPARS